MGDTTATVPAEPNETKSEKDDEYKYDSSDEEDLRNTVGNIPMHWYDDYPHIGYDLDGKQILKPAGSDDIEEFLKKIDDVDYWRTVKDKMTGQKVVLSDEDVAILQRIQSGKYPDSTDRYEPFEDFFTYETMKHPVSNRPEHKRSFVPSKIEQQKVGKLVHAIKMGWIKPGVPKDTTRKFNLIWDKETPDISKRLQHYIPAPKLKLPGHEESYNPPPEYLFTKEEEEQWQEQDDDERKLDFMPQKFSRMRDVPAYSSFIRERFERCLDLYLCPRQRKMKVNVDPDDLIPELPKPKDLQPFPSVQAMVYKGHTDMVRCIDAEPRGQFLASGSDDNTVKIWEVVTGRCLKTFKVAGIVKTVAWCSSEAVCLLSIASDNKVYLISPNVGDKLVISNTNAVLGSIPNNMEQKAVHWSLASKEQFPHGPCIIINHPKEVKKVTWHAKGDYFASLMPDAGNKAIVIHQLSQYRSQIPFQKLKGNVQSILFHPLRPFFFVATQRYIRMYNLLKQELTKKLMTNCKWVSSFAIHPQGNNLIVGSYDCRLSWFDLDLSNKPYKTMRHHKKAVRQVTFHKRYPLFASASDDGSIIVCHGMVYSDLLKNPLIVPVKVLKGHKTAHGLNVLDCHFHPLQPWIFTSGADGTIQLFS